MPDINSHDTPPVETADQGNPEEKQDKTFTQAELDAIIAERLSRAKKDQPTADELKTFRAWQEQQKTAEEKTAAAISKANQERDDAQNKHSALEKKMAVMTKGIPADKADAYVLLATAKVTDTVPFDKAIDAALADFPLPAPCTPSVPGTGGNPPYNPPPKDFSAMTSDERTELREKNPALYASMRKKYLGG